MKRISSLVFAAALVFALHSCGGDGGGGVPPEPNRAPVATGTIAAAEMSVGDTLTLDVSAYFSDPDGDALTYAVEVTSGDNVTAAVSGAIVTVAALARGEAVVTVTAQDGGGLSAQQSFTVRVPNRAPEATATIPAAELHAGDTVTIDLAAHFEDPDGDSLVFSAEASAPAVAEVTVTGGELTLAALSQGEAVVTVTARDGDGLSAEQSFTVTVPNRAPEVTAAIPAAELYVGDGLTVDLAAHFADPDGDSLAFSAEVAAPAVAEVTVTDGELAVAALAQGETVVTVTARDPGGLTASQVFTVMVPNRAPQATTAIPAAELHVGDGLEVALSEHFEDPDGDNLAFSADVSAPAVAEVTVTDGELTVAALTQGETVVTVAARDPGGLTATQSFTVTVPNRAPQATTAIPAAELHVGDGLAVALSDHFADPDGDNLAFSAEATAPAVADVTVTDGELTVAALTQGETVVTVTARDPGGLTASQVFTVTVPNRAPQATTAIPTAELHVGDGLTVALSEHFEDPDGDNLAFSAEATTPAVANVTVTDGELTVAALTQGETVVTVAARDPGGLTVSQSFTVTVPNRPPQATTAIPTAELQAGDSASVDLAEHFHDPDGDSLAYDAEVSAPAVAEVTVTDGALTVAALTKGEAVVTVAARDPGGLVAEQSFTVTVANRAPRATTAIPAAELREGDSLSVDLAEHFTDPDGDSLVFGAEISAPAVAEVTVTGGELAIAALAQGEAVVTVVARDGAGLSAEQTFPVSVRSNAGYLHVAFRHEIADLTGLALVLTGPVADSVRTAPELTHYRTATADEIRLVLLGPIPPAGTLFTFWTDDVTRVDEFTISAVEAVSASYEIRSLEGSEIAVRR